MRKLLLIGIGTGDPEHLTLQAVRALATADVVFILDKGEATSDLVEIRKEICEHHLPDRLPRFVVASDPERDRQPSDYGAAVEDWHAARAALYEGLFLEELSETGCGAILVWGDPALYDSTMRTVERVAARGRVDLDVEVIPGIGAVQLLTARHRIPLNRVGAAVTITTGRRLAGGFPQGADTVVVMLDGNPRFERLEPDLTIYWGAYLGTDREVLIAGRLGDVAERILETRRLARARHGWIMDTYLLRRPEL